MSQVLEFYDGEVDAPADPDANTGFHQVIIDRMVARAEAEHGWAGARFCSYSRERGIVCIGMAPGDGWPSIEDLRVAMPEIRIRREPELVVVEDNDGQGRMFG